jgi:hypothetical protein
MGENVIKVAGDQYWGFPLGTKSVSGWYTALQDAFNSESGQSRTDPIPGFNGTIWFIQVSKVGMDVFDLRRKSP